MQVATQPISIERISSSLERSLIYQVQPWSREEIEYVSQLCMAQQTELQKELKSDTGHVNLFFEAKQNTREALLTSINELCTAHPSYNLKLTERLLTRVESLFNDLEPIVPNSLKRFHFHIVYQKQKVGGSTLGGFHLHQHNESEKYPWLLIENIMGEGTEVVSKITIDKEGEKFPIPGSIRAIKPGERCILFQAPNENYHRAPKVRFRDQKERMFIVTWMSDNWIEEQQQLIDLISGKLPKDFFANQVAKDLNFKT